MIQASWQQWTEFHAKISLMLLMLTMADLFQVYDSSLIKLKSSAFRQILGRHQKPYDAILNPCRDILSPYVYNILDMIFVHFLHRQVFFYQILTLKSHDYHNTIIGAQNTAVFLQIQ